MGTESKHRVQRDVEQFHREVCSIVDSETPGIRRPELRARLIREEADETIKAILAGDLIEVIDGLCDLLCVVYGTAAELGINLAPFWDEVHRSNMAKKGGPIRSDGKALKPEGWKPPDIASVLQDELGLGRAYRWSSVLVLDGVAAARAEEILARRAPSEGASS